MNIEFLATVAVIAPDPINSRKLYVEPQWRTQLRLQHALALLAGGTPVTTTALACGWSNPSAFIEAFHGAFGATPGRFYAATA
jgi:AraC-like DNA-binding protein